ncbi:MAG: hypothetical protein NVS3B26_04760 [Mycobacteriales bacterium]
MGLAISAGVVLAVQRGGGAPRATGCSVTSGAASYPLDLAQAANAATIAAVAFRLGLSDHAVTIALATSLQESKLHNLDYGDRDSVGLFQQRPSQGWGPRERILDPHYAAQAFLTRLVHVPGWQTMSVAAAAQTVQRSASGSAYADWEPTARALARAFTGELPEGIACQFAAALSSSRGLPAALGRDMGPASTGMSVPSKAGWRTAAWLVAQAAQYDVNTVSFGGRRWTRASGRWGIGPAGNEVAYTVARR